MIAFEDIKKAYETALFVVEDQVLSWSYPEALFDDR